MKKITSAAAMVLLLFIAANCRTTNLTGSFVGLANFKSFTELAKTKITGETCRQHIFFVPVGSNEPRQAFQEAFKNLPEGATGLAHATVQMSVPLFGGVMFGRYCTKVSGYPAKSNLP